RSAGPGPQRALLARAADQDRQRLLDRRRVELAEPLLDHRQLGVEVAEAVWRGHEVVVVLRIVLFLPAGAETEDEAAAREVVDRAGHIGDQVRVTVTDRRAERP